MAIVIVKGVARHRSRMSLVRLIGKRCMPQSLTPFRLSNPPIIAGKPQELNMQKTTPEQNKTIVLKAFDTLFNKRDYAAAERFWSPNYIQHSAHIEPGR